MWYKLATLAIILFICGCNNSMKTYSSSEDKKYQQLISLTQVEIEFNKKIGEIVDSGEYEKAYKLVKYKVKTNDSNAENLMGLLYLNGWGPEKNTDEAVKWFEKSVEKYNNPSSYYHLAAIEMSDSEEERDINKVYEYNKKALDGKYPDAFNLQGILYSNGIYVEKNLNKAFSYYKEGAELGNRSSQYNLASAYQGGVGTNQDLNKAFYWYEKSYEQGNPLATISLASMYANGENVRKDYNKAIELLYPLKGDFGVAEHNLKLYCQKVDHNLCN